MLTTEITQTFKRHPVLASAFMLATLVALAFAASFIWRIAYWQIHADEKIEPWMTVGFVGHSWGIKPALIDQEAGLPLPVNGYPFTLQDIANQRGVPVSRIIADVEAAIAKLRKNPGEANQ